MLRGAFTNNAVRNRLPSPTVGGDGEFAHNADRSEVLPVLEAARTYRDDIPSVIVAGANYGAGSSRDWVTKAPAILGVKTIIARSFERIHRSNLIGMGVFSVQFAPGAGDLRLDGSSELIPLQLRLDTVNEVSYLRHGGTLPYVVRRALASGQP